MEWNDIATRVYFRDGSLRDIYIKSTNVEDWKEWVSFINQNYKIEFYDRRSVHKYDSIDFTIVIDYWGKINEEGIYAKIDIGEIKIMCYFNSEYEIENDFSPNDIKDINDHSTLIKYLINVSKTLNKHVLVTNEMQENEILIDVFNEKITYRR